MDASILTPRALTKVRDVAVCCLAIAGAPGSCRRLMIEVIRPLRTWLVVASLFTAVSVAFTFPLVLRGGSAFPHDAGDPSLNTWLLWWSTTRLPLSADWWNAAIFYPSRSVMALSELLIGLLPITAPVQWITGNPLLAYNVAFFLSFPLCGLAAYLLAFELTGRRDAAVLAGLVFAFGPYRMNELSHLQMLSYYWAPVALWALHRYLREPSARWLVVFAASWLMQSLSNGYALFHVSVLIVLWLIWFVRDVRKMVPILASWAVAGLLMAPALLAYRTAHANVHLTRDINEIRRFSADVTGFLSAPPELAMWGGRLLSSELATAMFPGLTVAAVILAGGVFVLKNRHVPEGPASQGRLRDVFATVSVLFMLVAVSAVVAGPWSIGSLLTVSGFHKPLSIAVLSGLIWFCMGDEWRRLWRSRSTLAFYVTAAAVMYLLALGPEPTFAGHPILYEPPYAWLMRIPGFDVLRVPARFGMAALLCQSAVVAMILSRWLSSASSRRSLALVAIGLGILADGWVRLPFIDAPSRPGTPFDTLAANGARAVIELPVGEPIVDFPAMYRGMFHGLPVANGFSGFAPPHYLPLVYAISRGHFDVLQELAIDGPIGVAIDRSLAFRGEMESGVSNVGSGEFGEKMARLVGSDEHWTMFVIEPRKGLERSLGQKLDRVFVRANRQGADVGLMTDGSVETAWSPGTPQDGTEEVTLEFSPLSAGEYAVVLSMGAYSFGFPRDLAIEFSDDGNGWSPARHYDAVVPTVRAALLDPVHVPVRIDVGGFQGRFMRLRQMGKDASPWWIAELSVHAVQ